MGFMKLVRVQHTNQHLNNTGRGMRVSSHSHLCTSGPEPKDENFWQELFIAQIILSLPFLFHTSQNLLLSALTFNFLGFVSLSQTLNLIQKVFCLFNFFPILLRQKYYEKLKKRTWLKQYWRAKLFFTFLKQREGEKCWFFYLYSPREKGEVEAEKQPGCVWLCKHNSKIQMYN